MLQIAGDESGSDGENLASATHRFFAYGTVDASSEAASELVHDLRRAAGSTEAEIVIANELKSSNLVNKHPDVLASFLGSEGRLGRHASVFIADKSYFLTSKLISLLVEEEASSRGIQIWPIERKLANELHDEVAPKLDQEAWSSLLETFNRLVRFYPVPDGRSATPYQLMSAINRARKTAPHDYSPDSLRLLWDSRGQAEQYADEAKAPVVRFLEPMIPVLLAVSGTWTDRYPGQDFELVADQHSSLTEEALDLIQSAAPVVGSGLRAISLADSKKDPRVQLADVVAGAGRHAAQTLQNGKLDPLTSATLEILERHGLWSDNSPIEAALRGL